MMAECDQEHVAARDARGIAFTARQLMDTSRFVARGPRPLFR